MNQLEHISFAIDGAIARIMLNRPDAAHGIGSRLALGGAARLSSAGNDLETQMELEAQLLSQCAASQLRGRSKCRMMHPSRW